jgi:hypothetical protein
MNTTKNLLIAAAISGALIGSPLVVQAASPEAAQRGAIERMGCNGKAGKKDKDSCKGHAGKGKKRKGKKGKDKSACGGKDGCSGKAGKPKAS